MSAGRAILLTPPGVAAIAVIRITGEGVAAFLDAHFSRPANENRCVHGEIRDGERVLDDAVVVLLPENRGANLNVHGGVWVVESVLQLLEREQFEIRRDAELPLGSEAVDAGSLLEQEVLTHLPLARTREAIGVLLSQTTAWDAYRARPAGTPSINEILGDRSLAWMLHPPRLAIVGAANAGKSTLANQLFAQERSIVADVPGTTRDWVGESANIDGLVVTLLDTPGLRETSDPIERTAIEQSRTQIEKADLVLLVLDASRDLAGQLPLVGEFGGAIVVLNKMDRARDRIDRFPEALRTVATTGAGTDALRLAIRTRFGCGGFETDRPRIWTIRQREILERALADRRALGEI